MYDAAQQELKDLFKTTEYLASARFIERSDALYDKLRGTGEWYSPGARVAYRACLEQTLTITARVPEASDQHAVCADAVPRSRSCRLRRRCSSFLLAAALDARAFLVAAVCADDVLPRSSLALSHADAVLVLRSRCLTALFVLARGLFERSSFSLAACSSALALARGLLERSSLSLAACSSTLRSRHAPAVSLRGPTCALRRTALQPALGCQRSLPCSSRRRGRSLPCSSRRRGRARVLRYIPLPSPVAHSPDVAVSRAQQHAEHPDEAARHGLTARTHCSDSLLLRGGAGLLAGVLLYCLSLAFSKRPTHL